MNSYNRVSNIDKSSENKVNVYIVITLAFILFSEFVLLSVFSAPTVTKRRTSAKRAACFSNIRLLQGAVEMYNMDKPNFMKSLDIDLLIKEKYLKTPPTPPENDCKYLSDGDLSDSGNVYCKFHGIYDEAKERELREKEK